ncbi:amino acid ABC transporter permease [Cryobacterium sp. Y82]|uniref:amino acid ABC transporter permease n=1 Tax=Cryobacterium sp. Y82 TaxID=2045017 RepID=UPI0018ED8429|nr:amino acid ABC transporter permease [Cryobacterium sp. Y82]
MSISLATPKPESLRRYPYRSKASIIFGVLITICAIGMLQSVMRNPNFGWDVVALYLTAPVILKGILVTLQLTVVCMVIGIGIGIVLAAMGQSNAMPVRAVAAAFVWFFRGTPLLIQLIFWFNLSALFPDLSVSVPFGPELFSIDPNALITPFFAAVLGLSLNEGAYMAEVIRGGLLGVGKGQTEAAQALGMKPLKLMMVVVLPQALRIIIPPTGNQTLGMLKNTSLVSVLAVSELLHSAQIIYSRNYETIPLLVVACIWYLVMTTLLSGIQFLVERKFKKSDRSSSRRGLIPESESVDTGLLPQPTDGPSLQTRTAS